MQNLSIFPRDIRLLDPAIYPAISLWGSLVLFQSVLINTKALILYSLLNDITVTFRAHDGKVYERNKYL